MMSLFFVRIPYVFALLMTGDSALAQGTYSVRIKDLSLVPVIAVPQDTATLHYRLMVKIDSAALGSKLHLLFGSTINSGNVMTAEGAFVHQGSGHFISFNGQMNGIQNYTASVPVELLSSYFPGLTHLTVYVEDQDGAISNKLYYSFNP